ncbi:MAG: 2-isopropylmalate synthase [bacterium]|nr:2-isopropylmalate synthase [bacterium]
MSTQIKIFDTTLRDGEQSPGAAMSEEQKIEMAIALDHLGIDRMEAGFPVSSPVQFNAVKKICEVVENATIVSLARCVEKDIDAAYEAMKNIKNKMVHVFIATSPLHREFKLKMSKEEVIKRIIEKMTYARKYFDLIEFSAEDASRTEPEYLYEVIRTVVKNGACAVNIPDTVGYAIPTEHGELMKGIVDNVPELKENGVDLSAHCHNDLGLAVANSIAAVQNGVTQVEVTMNGIGERAGNCSLEELIMTFNVRKDLLDFKTNIKTELLFPTSKLLQNITGLIIPRNKPILGDNVFAHESGIHQDGVIKHKETYEIMKPESIGRSIDALVMGRHSGKHAFKKKLEQYGMVLTPEQFEESFGKFTEVADKKKEVHDEDIFNIVSNVLGGFAKGYKLDYFHSYTGNTLIPSGTVRLKKDDKEYVSVAYGDGPVDALFNAVDKALGIETKLNEFQIQAIGHAKDAQGQVKIMLEIDGEEFVGKGASTDVMEASVLAYINAVNRKILRDE